jgi:hypothetical protein
MWAQTQRLVGFSLPAKSVTTDLRMLLQNSCKYMRKQKWIGGDNCNTTDTGLALLHAQAHSHDAVSQTYLLRRLLFQKQTADFSW